MPWQLCQTGATRRGGATPRADAELGGRIQGHTRDLKGCTARFRRPQAIVRRASSSLGWCFGAPLIASRHGPTTGSPSPSSVTSRQRGHDGMPENSVLPYGIATIIPSSSSDGIENWSDFVIIPSSPPPLRRGT